MNEPSPAEILKTEFSEEFVKGMRDRMVVSYFKYGPVADAYPDKVDAMKSAIARLHNYMDTGNAEWLMDAANFLMIEFMHPKHPTAHFIATSAEQSPGRITHRGLTDHRDNKEVGKNHVSEVSKFR